MSEYTTVLMKKETKEKLADFKEYGRESYDEVINKLMTIVGKLRDVEGELSEDTKKNIELSRKQAKEGKTVKMKDLMRELGI